MHRRPIQRLPYDVEARAHLMSAGERREVIEAQAIVDGDGRQGFPFVLRVQAFQPLRLVAVVGDGDRYVADLIAGRIEGNDLGTGGALRVVRLQKYATAERVVITQLVCRIRLQGVGDVLLVGVLRLAVEQNVTENVRGEGQAGIARRGGGLNVQRALGVLPTRHQEMIQLALTLLEPRAGIGCAAIYFERRPVGVGNARLETCPIRDLELPGGGAQCRTQSILLVENVFQVGEAVILRGVVVDGIRTAVRRLDAQVTAQKITRHEVIQIAGRAAVVEARRHLAVAAAVNGYGPTRIDGAAL